MPRGTSAANNSTSEYCEKMCYERNNRMRYRNETRANAVHVEFLHKFTEIAEVAELSFPIRMQFRQKVSVVATSPKIVRRLRTSAKKTS
jgi:hypothetical protein